MFSLLSYGGTDQDTLQKEYANQAEKLGFPAGRKVLILHADDIGMCEEANMAVIPYLENQQIQSASVMMPCEYSDEFMEWYKANADYDIGLHLTLTSEWQTWRWSTVADKDLVPSLLNSDEFMWHSVAEVVQNAKPEEVEKEIRAQIEKALSLGVKPTHLDTHMGTLYHIDAFSKIFMDIAEEYQIPALIFDLSNDSIIQKFEDRGIPITDYFIARCNDYSMPKLDDFEYIPGGNSYEEFRDNFFEVVTSLNPGIAEIIFHPSVESDKLKEITDSWQQRVWEAQLFADQEVIDFLREEQIIFTSWKELMERLFNYVNKDDETCADNTPCYPTIQEAIDAASSGATTIKITEGSYDEALTLSSSKDLTLQGGWDSTFTSQPSTTTVNSLTISNGSITVENLVIQ
ncbi:MAG: ChbG/HpnK family deacetylase [Deltaproteobacteria bacterium]|nr:ChbG/HpnK family deacetylase [Deltaproteobacteria bacterium]